MRRFRKHDRQFPLLRFKTFLLGRLKPPTVPPYLAAFRRFLYSTRPDAWRDAALVVEHFQSLNRRAQNNFSGVWRQWRFFIEQEDPESLPQLAHLTLGFYGDMRPVAEAIRRLVDTSVAKLHISNYNDVLDWKWKRNTALNVWTIASNNFEEKLLYFPPSCQPLLDLVRQWGWPDGCLDGYDFLPKSPMNMDDRMGGEAFKKMLQREVPPQVKAQIDALMNEARAASEKKLFPKKQPAGAPASEAASPAPAAAPAPVNRKPLRPEPTPEYVRPEPDEYYKAFELPPE